MATNDDGRSDPERHKLQQEMVACMPSLRAFAIALSGNGTHADDLVQQTMLQGIANLDKFESGTNLSAWLFTILRNRFRSDWRKSKREADWNPEFEDALIFSTGLGEGGAEATLELHRLLLYLACLPVDQSNALIAIGYLGMSYEDAAERFNCAVGTIKSRINRARNGLMRLIESKTVIKRVELAKLKTATKGVPKSHSYYPIAKAYEELYAACEDVGGGAHGAGVNGNGCAESSKSEQLWEALVASGVLDEYSENLDTLMRSESEEI